MNMVRSYIDSALYRLEGKVTFIIKIDAAGKATISQIKPHFKGNEMFIDDMKYALKKVKGKWTPALKNGVPADSEIIMNINFTTNTYDHD